MCTSIPKLFSLHSSKDPAISKQLGTTLVCISSNTFRTIAEPTEESFLVGFIESRIVQLLKLRPTLERIKQVHAQLITRQLGGNNNLIGAIIRSYGDCKNLVYARRVFDRYPSLPPTFLWNVIIQAHCRAPSYQESVCLFKEMLLHGGHGPGIPDAYTFTFALTACSRHPALARCGESIHTMVVKHGYESDVYVGNSLVNLYAASSRMIDARKLFDGMPQRDTITWTSLVRGYASCGELSKAKELFSKIPRRNDVSWAVMIAGYVGNALYSDALRCFNDMLDDGNLKPNEAVLVSVLSACAHLGALDQGRWVHIYIDKNRVSKSSNISTALIDMYAKCGRIDCAKQILYDTRKRDLLMRTSMISGLSMHGLGKEALDVFSDMLAEGVKPDDITLVGVLNACSHSGLVKEGLSVFHDMERLWGIKPKLEHFGCLIDLLGRAGRLEDALEAVKTMPMEPDVVIWRALLSACRIHGNIHLGEKILGHISRNMNPSARGGGRVLLSNLYASSGQWDNVAKVRKDTSYEEVESTPGCSYVEVDGIVHEFLAADKLHPRIREINRKLYEVMKRIYIEGGYIPVTKNVLFDLSEEDKEEAVSWHSEKLAVAFGLMSTPEGTPIRVVKNLRICEDCHSALKAMSRVFCREILVRDRSRFHKFSEGNCSCTDYW